MHNLKIREMTPTHVKKAITGHGHADKDQVANAVKYLMGFEKQKITVRCYRRYSNCIEL